MLEVTPLQLMETVVERTEMSYAGKVGYWQGRRIDGNINPELPSE